MDSCRVKYFMFYSNCMKCLSGISHFRDDTPQSHNMRETFEHWKAWLRSYITANRICLFTMAKFLIDQPCQFYQWASSAEPAFPISIVYRGSREKKKHITLFRSTDTSWKGDRFKIRCSSVCFVHGMLVIRV